MENRKKMSISASPMGKHSKYPVNIKRRKDGRLSSLMAENEISYNPIDASQSSNLIKFVPEGVSKNNTNFSNKNKEKNMNEILMYKWINRQDNNQKKQIKFLRRYKRR